MGVSAGILPRSHNSRLSRGTQKHSEHQEEGLVGWLVDSLVVFGRLVLLSWVRWAALLLRSKVRCLID